MLSYTVSPEFAPQEPPVLLRIEHAFFIEIAFEAILYGMTAMLFFLTIRSFIIHQGLKKSWKMITFLSIQHIAIFIGVFANIHFIMLSFVYNRNVPGGPAAFQNKFSNLPISLAALAGYTISNWFQDALLLWRFLIIWNKNYKLFVLPLMLFLASVSFSITFAVKVGSHAGLLNDPHHLKIIITYFSTSVGLNFVLTFLIAFRLLYFRRKDLIILGPSHPSSKRVFTVVEIIVESAALYTVSGIVQIVAIPTNPAVEIAVSGIYGAMSAFVTVLISYRVSQGRAYTTQTFAERSTTRPTFNTHSQSESSSRVRAGESTTALSGNEDDIPLQIRTGSKDSIQGKNFNFSHDSVEGVKLDIVTMTRSDFEHDTQV